LLLLLVYCLRGLCSIVVVVDVAVVVVKLGTALEAVVLVVVELAPA
jgi:hypothetical protein